MITQYFTVHLSLNFQIVSGSYKKFKKNQKFDFRCQYFQWYGKQAEAQLLFQIIFNNAVEWGKQVVAKALQSG